MAQLETTWSTLQTRSQFAAIAWLRWRILVNSFRRKGGVGEIIGRVLLYPLLAGFAIGPSIGVLFGAFFIVRSDAMQYFVLLLWGTFAFCQLLNIQLGQPGATFDPTELIRFPLTVRNYVWVRLCFGLLTPANVIGTLMSLSIAIGTIAAAPALWLWALLALGIFALTNVLFSRMVFAWVDRWLATRRAREIFTALVFAFSIGIQWVNFTFNPAYNHGHHNNVSAQKVHAFMDVYHRVTPLLNWLPPELTSSALRSAQAAHSGAAAIGILCCLLYATAFLLIFALRIRTEFHGENLSDVANATTSAKKPVRSSAAVVAVQPAALVPLQIAGPQSPITTILGKEFLYLRRHTGTLYGIVMPIFLVLIFVSRFSARSGSATWIFPAAAAYTLLAVGAMSYNAFGYEATGAQLYFLAPVRMRDVLLAKNLLNFSLVGTEVALTLAIITYSAGPPSWIIALSTLLWAVATMLLTTMVGNRRSFSSPKKINTQKVSRNSQVSQLSGLIAMGILLGSVTLGCIPLGLGLYFDKLWVMLPVFAVYAGAAFFFYARSLQSTDRVALQYREHLFEELCKGS